MTHEASFHSSEAQPPPEWSDLAEQARELIERSKTEPIGEADATIIWIDDQATTHTLSHFENDAFTLYSWDKDAVPTVDIEFDANGPGEMAYADGFDDQDATQARIAGILRQGPGSDHYRDRISRATSNVWDATWELVAGPQAGDADQLSPEHVDDRPMIPLQRGIEASTKSTDDMRRESSARLVRRVDITGPNEQGFATLLSTYVEYYDGDDGLRRQELDRTTLYGDGLVEFKDTRQDVTTYSREPHVIQHMADRMNSMLELIRSGKNTIE